MLKLDFCPTNKSFSQIFKIYAYLYDLSFIWQNFEKNQRTFFSTIHNHLPSTVHRHPLSTTVRHNKKAIAWNPGGGDPLFRKK